LLVDELLDRLTRRGILCQGYADDIGIIARGKYEETLCDIIQLGLNMTSEWCKEVGLSLNPRNTVIVPFTNRYKLQRMKAINLSECLIEVSNENKYLWITLDSKLSFKTHVDNTIDKCTRSLFTCRTSLRIIRWLYLMVVRPILTYGTIAEGDRARLSTTKVKFHKLQRMVCICMTEAIRPCPTAALEVLMEVTPLPIVIEMKRKATLIRIEGAGNDCNLTSKDAESLKRNIPLLMQPRDAMPVEHSFAQNFSTHLNNKNSWTSLGKVHPMKPQTINIHRRIPHRQGKLAGGCRPQVEIPRINGQIHQHFLS